MKLRTAKFPNGDSVKARVKSSATASPLTPNAVVYNPKISMMYAPQFNANTGGSSNSRKKRSNNKGRNNNNNNSGGNSNNKSKNNQQNGGNGSKRRSNKDINSKQTSSNDSSKTRSKKVTMKAPSMGISNFPSLPPTSDGNSKSVQVQKVVMDGEMLKGCGKERNSVSGFSDSSSTATTSTASTPTEVPPSGVMSGYAAALLKPAAPVPVTTKKPIVSEKPRQQAQAPSKKTKDSAKKISKTLEAKTEDKKKTIESEEQPIVTVKPPSWGQGRSFADIVSA